MLYPLNGGLNERAPHMDGRDYTDTWKLELERPGRIVLSSAALAGDGGEHATVGL